MSERRALGGLEDQVMTYLWAVDAAATPAEVHQAVAPELAYTTIMTVLTRMWKKELLQRERRGRAYAYRSAKPEADHRAGLMQTAFQHAGDRSAVLSSFVDALDPDEAELLRQLLGEVGE